MGIDAEFTSYPLRAMADAALLRARDLGAGHADFRAERIRAQHIGLADGRLETLHDGDDLGLAVRVVVDGTWGFAATADLTPEAAAGAAAAAVDVARVAAAMNAEPIELAAEPGHGEVTWESAYQADPLGEDLLDEAERTRQLIGSRYFARAPETDAEPAADQGKLHPIGDLARMLGVKPDTIRH